MAINRKINCVDLNIYDISVILNAVKDLHLHFLVLSAMPITPPIRNLASVSELAIMRPFSIPGCH